jgi:hypothetical protein
MYDTLKMHGMNNIKFNLYVLDKRELLEYFYSQFYQPLYKLGLQELVSSLQ